MMEKLINYILMQSQRTFMCFAIFKSDTEIRLNLSAMFKDNKRSNKCIGRNFKEECGMKYLGKIKSFLMWIVILENLNKIKFIKMDIVKYFKFS